MKTQGWSSAVHKLSDQLPVTSKRPRVTRSVVHGSDKGLRQRLDELLPQSCSHLQTPQIPLCITCLETQAQQRGRERFGGEGRW